MLSNRRNGVDARIPRPRSPDDSERAARLAVDKNKESQIERFKEQVLKVKQGHTHEFETLDQARSRRRRDSSGVHQ